MSQDSTDTHGAGADAGANELPAPPTELADERGDDAGDEAGDEPDDAVSTAGGGPSLSRAAVLLRSWRLAWGVAVVAVLVAVVSLGWAATLAAEERRANAARERAETVAEQVTTFRGADIDQWVTETQELATGDYAEQVAGLFDDEFRQALRENEVESEGEIERAYLQRLDGDTAEVFVVARQESTNVLRDEAVEDQLRMDITLRHENGEWLASDIAVLNPAAAPGPGDAAPGGTSEPGDGDQTGDEGDGSDGGESGEGSNS